MGLAQRWMAVDRAEAVAAARERAGVPDLTAREAWGTRDAAAVKAILAEAKADRAQPWPQTLLSDYARFWRDGARTPYETPAGELRRRTSTAVVAAALTADQGYVDEAADGLFLCEQTTWCWAAHESFAAERHEVLGDPTSPTWISARRRPRRSWPGPTLCSVPHSTIACRAAQLESRCGAPREPSCGRRPPGRGLGPDCSQAGHHARPQLLHADRGEKLSLS